MGRLSGVALAKTDAHAVIMNQEIEAKIKVSSLEPIEEKLKELNADFVRSVQQTDAYLTDADGRLRKNDCALRIRRQVIDNESSALMTFKGPRADGKFKNRTEYETGIADAETGEKIFESLGYHKAIVIEKKLILDGLGGTQVFMDELPRLGCFVEVEGPSEDIISGALKKLNLHNEPHITESYASMMSRELNRNNA